MFRGILSANAILLVQFVVQAIVPLLLVPHLIKTIGLAKYGSLVLAMAWGGYGALITQFAFNLTGPKRLAQLPEGESVFSVFACIQIAKIILFLLILPVLVLIGFVSFGGDDFAGAAWLLIVGLPLSASLNAVWYLQVQNQFLWVALLSISGSLFALLAAFILVTDRGFPSVLAAAFACLIGNLSMSAGTLLLGMNSACRKGCLRINFDLVVAALRDGFPLFGSQLVAAFYSASGPIIINSVLGPSSAGAFGAVHRVVSAVSRGCGLTHIAAYPRLAAAYKNNRDQYWRILKVVLGSYLCLASIFAFGSWVFRDITLNFLFGGVAGQKYGCLWGWSLAWLVLWVFGTALTGYLTVSGRGREVMPLTMKYLAISLLFGLPGLLRFGPAGWMAGLVISQAFVVFDSLNYWRKEYGLNSSDTIQRT